MRKFRKGETINPIVYIEKVKNGVPTVIKLGDHTFILRHDDQFIKGGKNNEKNK